MNNSNSRTKQHQAGFSLLEVVIVMAIVSILLIVGIPNFTKIMETNQATEQSHNFISIIQLSASQAQLNNLTTTVCAKKQTSDECVNFTTSPSSSTWRHGWLMFTDSNNSGIFEPSSGDTLIKAQVNGNNQVEITAPASSVTISSGGVVTRGKGDFLFAPSNCFNNGHRVTIYSTGQLSVKGGECS